MGGAQVAVQFLASTTLLVDKGMVTGVETEQLHQALRANYRSDLAVMGTLIEAWPLVEAALKAHYFDHFQGCC